mmetsp:Transcript_3085/g.8361  ORF Transcript_3085/g.8361 Transcript_3085/m.8361 type:complete len:720 (+) Transcript_3085:382-2541(+)|eukprot:CAMPEP_0197184814 /NCGR_PEP_ID=MMETSP1423-20130617/10648_1 /TAXON_ID=476441 /ORGANISM="Pseudo-nitzschia heimii, Strain UNC1101" /LENGTH=719 /DNA_ID=CAMNT_0042635731 /DNA_START=290 /DNA_END=2449 /DNA_ORIENTATION=+
MATPIWNSTGRLMVLLAFFCVLSVSRGEVGTHRVVIKTRELQEQVATSGGTLRPGFDGKNVTEAPTEDPDDDSLLDVGNDDGLDLEDILPGLANQDIDNFVANYILGNPEYYSTTYDPPGMVPKFNKLPRFSHSDDISKLVGDKPQNYFLGLLFIGTFIMTFFAFWGIVIWILKCIGPNHVGVLAGFPFREEGRKSLMGRMILGLSSWIVIAATIVLITKGMTELQSLSDTIDITVTDIQLIESDVKDIVTTLQVVSAKTKPIRDELVDFLKRDICPLEPGTDTEDMIRSVGEDTYDAMSELDDFIEGYLDDVESGADQTSRFTDRIKTFVEYAQFTNNWKVAVVLFPFFIVPSFILVAVCMGWFDVFSESFYTFLTWVILPLLIIQTIIAVVSSAWIVIVLQANSDLCMPKPDNTIVNILDTVELEPDSSVSRDDNGPNDNFFYDIMVFYTSQCTAPNPWLFLQGHYTDLARGKSILGEFLQSIEDTTLGQLSQECGHEYGPIVELLIQLQDLITILAQMSKRALNLMRCSKVVPLYTTSLYEATCTMSPIGLTWMLGCSLVISFFGMLSIMFRGAYYPIDYYYYDEKDIYPTEDESGDDEIAEPLADSECNDRVLKHQQKQAGKTMERMLEETHFDVYNDDQPSKEENETDFSTNDDNDYSFIDPNFDSIRESTYDGGDSSYSTGLFGDYGYDTSRPSLTTEEDTQIEAHSRSVDSC